MDEAILRDPVALAERLNEWQQSLALAVDALKRIAPEETHEILDTIEACVADARTMILAFQEAYVAEAALFEKFADEMRVAVSDLRAEIARRSSQPHERSEL